MRELLEPKKIEVDGKKIILSKFPAVAGREIVTQWGSSAIPKVGDYEKNQEMMRKLMHFVAVEVSGVEIRLTTDELIDSHLCNWETLAKVELHMLRYNCENFQTGRLLSFLTELAQQVPEWISSTLTRSLEQLLAKNTQPGAN